jgi:hypothetical protein
MGGTQSHEPENIGKVMIEGVVGWNTLVTAGFGSNTPKDRWTKLCADGMLYAYKRPTDERSCKRVDMKLFCFSQMPASLYSTSHATMLQAMPQGLMSGGALGMRSNARKMFNLFFDTVERGNEWATALKQVGASDMVGNAMQMHGVGTGGSVASTAPNTATIAASAPPKSGGSPMPFCGACGTKNANSLPFCSQCGHQLT